MPFHYFLPIPDLDPAVSDQSGQVELIEWLRKEGDTIHAGTPIARVRTWWAVLEVQAAADGRVGRLIFEANTHVKVGDPIAVIYADGESLPYGRPPSSVRTVEILRPKPASGTKKNST
jgi:pyruvate/2-oxoglutarate dehydrogenase complex dihydrolipoamide acyltransferase (E2) component